VSDDQPTPLESICNLAFLFNAQGKLAEAEPHLREALEVRRAKLGDEHPDTLSSLNNLAGHLYVRGEHYEAGSLLREVLAGRHAKLGEEHPDTLFSINSLACVLQAQGKLSEAEDNMNCELTGIRGRGGSHCAPVPALLQMDPFFGFFSGPFSLCIDSSRFSVGRRRARGSRRSPAAARRTACDWWPRS